jgi:hypothetical protein
VDGGRRTGTVVLGTETGNRLGEDNGADDGGDDAPAIVVSEYCSMAHTRKTGTYTPPVMKMANNPMRLPILTFSPQTVRKGNTSTARSVAMFGMLELLA